MKKERRETAEKEPTPSIHYKPPDDKEQPPVTNDKAWDTQMSSFLSVVGRQDRLNGSIPGKHNRPCLSPTHVHKSTRTQVSTRAPKSIGHPSYSSNGKALSSIVTCKSEEETDPQSMDAPDIHQNGSWFAHEHQDDVLNQEQTDSLAPPKQSLNISHSSHGDMIAEPPLLGRYQEPLSKPGAFRMYPGGRRPSHVHSVSSNTDRIDDDEEENLRQGGSGNGPHSNEHYDFDDEEIGNGSVPQVGGGHLIVPAELAETLDRQERERIQQEVLHSMTIEPVHVQLLKEEESSSNGWKQKCWFLGGFMLILGSIGVILTVVLVGIQNENGTTMEQTSSPSSIPFSTSRPSPSPVHFPLEPRNPDLLQSDLLVAQVTNNVLWIGPVLFCSHVNMTWNDTEELFPLTDEYFQSNFVRFMSQHAQWSVLDIKDVSLELSLRRPDFEYGELLWLESVRLTYKTDQQELTSVEFYDVLTNFILNGFSEYIERNDISKPSKVLQMSGSNAIQIGFSVPPALSTRNTARALVSFSISVTLSEARTKTMTDDLDIGTVTGLFLTEVMNETAREAITSMHLVQFGRSCFPQNSDSVYLAFSSYMRLHNGDRHCSGTADIQSQLFPLVREAFVEFGDLYLTKYLQTIPPFDQTSDQLLFGPPAAALFRDNIDKEFYEMRCA